MRYDTTIPWSVARKLIDLEYTEEIYEYIYKITDQDLENYKRYIQLQRHYNTPTPRNEADWSDILKLILVEEEYRELNNIYVED